MTEFRSERFAIALAAFTALLACSGGTATPAAADGGSAQDVAVTVSPGTATVVTNGTVAFAAAVTGTINTAVTWSTLEGSCGSVAAGGLYTAPGAAATCHVVATSNADPTKSGSASVTVTAPPPPPPPVTVTIAPTTASVLACRTTTFTATVANAANTSVTWSVQEGAAGGTVTSAGVYTAPTNAGTYHVVATSVQDPTKKATSTVTVTEQVLSVAVAPTTITVAANGTTQFTATVTTTCGAFTATNVVGANGVVSAKN